MTKLEIQINQILLAHPNQKTTAQILHDESINHRQLFLVAEIRAPKHHTAFRDLKQICEIIILAFQSSKLSSEALFETSLASINQQLADLAHQGRRSWLARFSAVIALAYQNRIFLSHTGNAVALLKRQSELSALAQPQKPVGNPLKTFESFSAGKVKEGDVLILAINNIFNYLSLDLMNNVLTNPPATATERFSQILTQTAPEEQFACFVLAFGPGTDLPATAPSQDEIYAPLPEDEPIPKDIPNKPGQDSRRDPGGFPLRTGLAAAAAAGTRLLRAVRWKRQSPRLGSLPPVKKFFLASFLIFLLLFAANLAVFGIRRHQRNIQTEIAQQLEQLATLIHEAESAMIYQDDSEAVNLLARIRSELAHLEQTGPKGAEQVRPTVQELGNRINKINLIENPALVAELNFQPQFMVRAGSGFLLAGREAKDLVFWDQQPQHIFLLNNPSSALQGIIHIAGLGHVLATAANIYVVDEAQKTLRTLIELADADISGMEFLAPNRLYILDKHTNQVLRFPISSANLGTPSNVFRTSIPLSDIQDFGLDQNVYLLSPNTITRVVNGLPQAFPLPPLSEPPAAADKLVVNANLYLLEARQNRLLILDKQGRLLNQIIFPTLPHLTDLYVDEQTREIYLLNDNKIFRITF